MRLVKCDREVIGNLKSKKSDNYKLLVEFTENGIDCAEVVDFTQKNAKSCATSLVNSIKRFRIHGVKCIQRKEKVYLIKIDDKLTE